MPELITNPYSGADPQPDRSGAGDGPEGFAHPSVVVRYDSPAGPSDEEAAGEGDGDASTPDRSGFPALARAGAAALSSSLVAAASLAGRTAYRYPRWAAVVALSVVVLGGIAVTRPGRATPLAEIPPPQTANNSPGPDENKDPKDPKPDPKDDKKDPKPDPTLVAVADPAAAEKPKSDPEKPADTPPVAAPAESKDPAKGATSPTAAAAPANPAVAAASGSTGPDAHDHDATKPVVPAPPQLTAQAGGPASAPQPATVPEPPVLPGSDLPPTTTTPALAPPALTSVDPKAAASASASPTTKPKDDAPPATANDLMPPLPGSNLTLTGATETGNKSPSHPDGQAKNPTDAAAGSNLAPVTPPAAGPDAKAAPDAKTAGPDAKPASPSTATEPTAPPVVIAAPGESAKPETGAAAEKGGPAAIDPKDGHEPRVAELPATGPAAKGASASTPAEGPPGPAAPGGSEPPRIDGPPVTPETKPGEMSKPEPLPRVDQESQPPLGAPLAAAPANAAETAKPAPETSHHDEPKDRRDKPSPEATPGATLIPKDETQAPAGGTGLPPVVQPAEAQPTAPPVTTTPAAEPANPGPRDEGTARREGPAAPPAELSAPFAASEPATTHDQTTKPAGDDSTSANPSTATSTSAQPRAPSPPRRPRTLAGRRATKAGCRSPTRATSPPS